MAFGFGKKWLKRVSGLSAAQRKLSRKLGIRLSDGLPGSRGRRPSSKEERSGQASRGKAGFSCGQVLAAACALVVFLSCGFCVISAVLPGKSPPPASPAPPREDRERIQGAWVDAAGEWVWEFAGDELTLWRRGEGEANTYQVVLWPAPANQIDLWGNPRRGIYRFDSDTRLTIALGPDALHRPKMFDPADNVELVVLRPLREAEAEWEAQARQVTEPPVEVAQAPPPDAGTPAAPSTASKPPAHVDPPQVAGFSPVPPAHASRGPKDVHVGSYTRKDGTVVHAHDRAAPGMGGGKKR